MKTTKFFLATLLMCLSHSPVFYAMDLADIWDESSGKNGSTAVLSPKGEIDLFDVSTEKNDRLLQKLMNSHMLISPDGKQLIVGIAGAIHSVNISPNAWFPHSPHQKRQELFAHPHVKNVPIFALSQKENGPLFIASAGNYHDENTKEKCAHLVLYSNSRSTHQTHKGSVQAMKFDGTGDILIVGGQYYIVIYNLALQKTEYIPFKYEVKRDPLMDVAITKDGSFIVAASAFGCLGMIEIKDKKCLTTGEVQYFATRQNIEKMHIPHEKTLIMHNNRPSMITKLDIVGAQELQDQQKLKMDCLSFDIAFEEVALNSDWCVAYALWTKNEVHTKKERHTINVCMHNADQSEEKKFILKAPTCAEQYFMHSSNTGREELHNEHFLAVSFHGKNLVALSSCGKIFLWQVPLFPTNTYTSNLTGVGVKPLSIGAAALKKMEQTRLNRSRRSESVGSSKSDSLLTPRKNTIVKNANEVGKEMDSSLSSRKKSSSNSSSPRADSRSSSPRTDELSLSPTRSSSVSPRTPRTPRVDTKGKSKELGEDSYPKGNEHGDGK